MAGRLRTTCVLALAVVAAAPIAAAAPASAAVHQRHVVTPSGAGTLHDQVVPLAGSPTTLVYSRQHRLARDVNPVYDGDGSNLTATGAAALFARTAAGDVTRLGALPARDDVFSLVGTTLAAAHRSGQGYPTRTVDWWDLVSGDHGQLTLDSGTRFLAAAPGGVAYVAADGTLMRRSLGGDTTTFAAPFPGGSNLVFGAAGEDGLVVGDRKGQVVYLPWSDPEHPVALDNPTNDFVECRAVVDGYAACLLDIADEGALTDGAILLPLDGSAATVADPSCPAYAVGLSGSTLLFPCSRQPQSVLASQQDGESAATVSSTAVDVHLASAYGQAVAAEPLRDGLIAAHDATDATTVVTAAPSPVTADGIALTGDRIVYAADVPVPADPDAVVSVFERKLTVEGGRLHVGAPHRLSADGEAVAGNIVAAHGRTTVYGTVDPNGLPTGEPTVTLHVLSPLGDATIRHTYGRIDLAGHRLLYLRIHDGDIRHEVYNLRTHHRQAVGLASGRSFTTDPVLSGHHIAYANRSGAVRLLDLRTGHARRIAPAPPARSDGWMVAVYAQGHYVGWSAHARGASRTIDGLRNVRTMAPAVALGRTLYDLTPAGALLDRTATYVTDTDGYVAADGAVPAPTPFWLRPYAGGTHQLLARRAYLRGPAVDGRTVAWVNAHGRLLVGRAR